MPALELSPVSQIGSDPRIRADLQLKLAERPVDRARVELPGNFWRYSSRTDEPVENEGILRDGKSAGVDDPNLAFI